jgi:putative lipoprotein
MMLRPELIMLMLVLACAHHSQPSPEGGVLSGTVAYRERMALPSDAVIQVQLSDVSVQDVPAPVVAETTVDPQGRQVPLPFELHYDAGKVDPKRTYAVRAAIRSEGQLLFTTTGATHVLTQGNPSRVDLVLTKAAARSATAGGVLSGSTWKLEDLGGTAVLDQPQATLEFPDEGRVAGKGSCNRFFGSVQVSGESISFGALGSTRMACPDAVMTQEAAYFNALQNAERYVIDGSSLLIYSRGMDKPLRFSRTGS